MSMAWPKYFYYLVWIGPIFIMDPILYQSGKKSILTDWQNMDLSFWAQAFMSGLACGFLWEMWNYWSGAKWYYTVPLVGNLKLFEMPVLGFLGFPVFALEAFLFMGLLDLGREKLAKMDAPRQAFLTLAIVLLVLFFDLAVFWGIDEFTVVSLAAK